jgi:hypothetical protein
VLLSIEGCLAPSYFISYSRVQKQTAALIRTILAGGERTIWFDRDAIAPGDDWQEEIRKGIAAADEVILLLSDDSIASEPVAKELCLAREARKPIRPFVVAPLTVPPPRDLAELHYEDLSGDVDAPDRLRTRLAFHLGEAGDAALTDAALKLRACRRIWPAFAAEFASQAGLVLAQGHAARLERLRGDYHAASAIQLNAGVMHCAAGDWEAGLALLRAYARAANNFAGWYFLALHLPRRAPIRGVPLRVVEEASDAIGRATRLGDHPLALLTAAILETGGRNMGAANLRSRMSDFAASLPANADPPAEYLRAYWCLKPSFQVLAPHDQPVRDLIKEMVT